MWGTLFLTATVLPHTRFIPTHVGNTTSLIFHPCPVPVHPHACGEHSCIACLVIFGNGSSPRMWGTRQLPVTNGRPARFIPTHVGNTCLYRNYRPSQPVHPHACGEHKREMKPKRTYSGSSPRMWGTRMHVQLLSAIYRFIPTHVGNTLQAVTTCCPRPVHPHACGEHFFQASYSFSASGSSPRMWGTHGYAASPGRK